MIRHYKIHAYHARWAPNNMSVTGTGQPGFRITDSPGMIDAYFVLVPPRCFDYSSQTIIHGLSRPSPVARGCCTDTPWTSHCCVCPSSPSSPSAICAGFDAHSCSKLFFRDPVRPGGAWRSVRMHHMNNSSFTSGNPQGRVACFRTCLPVSGLVQHERVKVVLLQLSKVFGRIHHMNNSSFTSGNPQGRVARFRTCLPVSGLVKHERTYLNRCVKGK